MTRNGINSDSIVWVFFGLLVVVPFCFLNLYFKFMVVKKGSDLQQLYQVSTGADAASLPPVVLLSPIVRFIGLPSVTSQT